MRIGRQDQLAPIVIILHHGLAVDVVKSIAQRILQAVQVPVQVGAIDAATADIVGFQQVGLVQAFSRAV